MEYIELSEILERVEEEARHQLGERQITHQEERVTHYALEILRQVLLH